VFLRMKTSLQWDILYPGKKNGNRFQAEISGACRQPQIFYLDTVSVSGYAGTDVETEQIVHRLLPDPGSPPLKPKTLPH